MGNTGHTAGTLARALAEVPKGEMPGSDGQNEVHLSATPIHSGYPVEGFQFPDGETEVPRDCNNGQVPILSFFQGVGNEDP